MTAFISSLLFFEHVGPPKRKVESKRERETKAVMNRRTPKTGLKNASGGTGRVIASCRGVIAGQHTRHDAAASRQRTEPR